MKKIRALSVGAVALGRYQREGIHRRRALNVAINLKRLGAESAFVTCVGRDAARRQGAGKNP